MSEATQGRPAAQEFERAGAATAQASFENQALSSIQRVQRFLHSYPTIVPFVVLVLGVLLGAAVNFSHFVTATNFLTVLTQVMIVGILAIGQTFVILTAGIDLSVGVTMVISSIVMGRLAVVDGFAHHRSVSRRPADRRRLRLSQRLTRHAAENAALYCYAWDLEHHRRPEHVLLAERNHSFARPRGVRAVPANDGRHVQRRRSAHYVGHFPADRLGDRRLVRA